MPDMKDVFSSHVGHIGYEDGNLIVQWQNGKTSVYSDVPAEVAERVMNAPSVGSALRETIKGAYNHRYL